MASSGEGGGGSFFFYILFGLTLIHPSNTARGAFALFKKKSDEGGSSKSNSSRSSSRSSRRLTPGDSLPDSPPALYSSSSPTSATPRRKISWAHAIKETEVDRTKLRSLSDRDALIRRTDSIPNPLIKSEASLSWSLCETPSLLFQVQCPIEDWGACKIRMHKSVTWAALRTTVK